MHAARKKKGRSSAAGSSASWSRQEGRRLEEMLLELRGKGSWQELASAVRLHPTTLQRYREGKLQPTREACLEFTSVALAREGIERLDFALPLTQRRQEIVLRHWLDLTRQPQERDKQQTDSDCELLTRRVRDHLFRFEVPEPERELMEVCKKTQDLALRRSDALCRKQAAYSQPVVVAFLWLWKGAQTTKELAMQQSNQFINRKLRDNPAAQVWMFFAMEGDDISVHGDIATAIRDLSMPDNPASSLWDEYANRLRVYAACRPSYRHLGDYWLFLPDTEEPALAFLVARNRHLQKRAEESRLEHIRQHAWDYCAQAVELHDEQVRSLTQYFGIEYKPEAVPPWIVSDGNWEWKAVLPGHMHGH